MGFHHKMPRDRFWAAVSLAETLRKRGPEIAADLEKRLSAVLAEGEEMPDVALLLDLIGRMLARQAEDLDQADKKRSSKGSEASAARRELRERVEPELRERVIWVRDQLRNAYGAKEAAVLIDHEGRTPRGLADLGELAETMVSRLPGLDPPKVRTGRPPDLLAWAEYLQPTVDEFSRLLSDLELTSGDASDEVDVKKQAMAAFDRTYRRVMRLTVLFYQLAGWERGVKLLRRRVGRPAEKTRGGAPRVA